MRKSTFIRRVFIPIISVFLLSFGSLLTQTRAMDILYVKPGGNDSNNCRSPETACETINGAVGKSSSGQIIHVAAATYTGTGSNVVHITQSVTISGGWNMDFSEQTGFSTIDGENIRRGLKIDIQYVPIDHFIIRNGSAVDGAGVFTEGNVTFDDCLIINNSATGGGGVYVGKGELTFNHCTIEDNDATNEGGGIFIQNGTRVDLINSTLNGNSANSGGGIFLAWGTLSMENSTISGNSANGGGGINNLGGEVLITNGTISDNSLGTMGGGGIRNEAGGYVSIKNTIIAGNNGGFAADCNNTITSSGYNLIGNTDGCTFTPTTGDIINVDPKLGPLANNGGPTQTHALLSTSPAIDTGNNLSCESTDQRGISRPVDGDQDSTATCDMGAFEYVPPTFPDVPWEHWAVYYVEAIYDAGLTTGYPDGTYRPQNPVTRAEMAVFLLKGMGITPPALDGSHPFSDISGHWAEAWIEELYDQGITGGYPDGTYRPENQVTRAEMAIFLLKGIGVTPPASDGSHPFSDIAGHWAEIFIEELYDQGITGGYPDGTYRPQNQVTRAEMAVFLVKTFNLPMP